MMNIQITDPNLIAQIKQLSTQNHLSPERLIKLALEALLKEATPPEPTADQEQLLAWQTVYDGLDDDLIEQVEAIALNRRQFMLQRDQ
ncbi:MAG: hypothetical protein AAF629_00220 [Chloroflexota bacterium]